MHGPPLPFSAISPRFLFQCVASFLSSFVYALAYVFYAHFHTFAEILWAFCDTVSGLSANPLSDVRSLLQRGSAVRSLCSAGGVSTRKTQPVI